MSVLARSASIATLVVAWCVSTADASPILVRGGSAGVMQIDRVEDLVGLIGQGYQLLTPAESAAWEKRRDDDERVSAAIARKAESRVAVYVVGALVILYVIGIIKLVNWIRRRKPKRPPALT